MHPHCQRPECQNLASWIGNVKGDMRGSVYIPYREYRCERHADDLDQDSIEVVG